MTVLSNLYTDLKGVLQSKEITFKGNKSTFFLFLVHLLLQTESWNVAWSRSCVVHLVNTERSNV